MVALPRDLEGAKKLPWTPYAGRNISYFVTYAYLRDTYGKLYEKILGVRFSYVFVEGQGLRWQMYRSPPESKRLENYVYERLNRPEYVGGVFKKIAEGYSDYREHAYEFLARDFPSVSPAQLADDLEEHVQKLVRMVASISCSIIFADAFGKKLQELVPQNVAMKMALPLNKTLPLEEEIGFWRLVAKLKEGNVDEVHSLEELPSDLSNALRRHFSDYCWIEAYENDAVWTTASFLKRVNDALEENADEKAGEAEDRHASQEREIAALSAEYGIDGNFLKLFRQAMFDRIAGESILGLGNYGTKVLFAAVAKKLYLPANQIKWFSDEELVGALRGEGKAEELADVLPVRQKHYLVALGDKDVHAFEGREVDEILGQLNVEKPVKEDVRELKGISACPGVVRGVARIVLDVGELDKVKQGDILVTLNTTPAFVLAMKRSAAIVTDEGGITCHAAIVSRELGIPCIIGTKAGTVLIPDGANIEVDAVIGKVRILG